MREKDEWGLRGFVGGGVGFVRDTTTYTLGHIIRAYLGCNIEAGIETLFTDWVGSFNVRAQFWIIWED